MNERSKPTIRKKIDHIEGLVYSDTVPIKDLAIWETKEHVTPQEASKQTFKPYALGSEWGGPWASAWFRARFALPASLAGRNVVARITTGGEAVAFIRHTPVVGLNRHRDEVPLPKNARPGRRFEILVEAGANDAFGGLVALPRATRAEIAAVREEVRQLCYDLRFLFDAMENLDGSSARSAEILHLLEEVAGSFDFDAPDPDKEAARARRILRPLFARQANASSTEATLSGHAHIDVAWKWPLAETTRKCARTFSSVIAYMDRFPEFRFTQTQAYLYEVTRRRYPKLYRRICDAIKARKWEVSTGMYVEADCNVTSGESLVRQVMFGKRFAREEFGADVDVLVLPDVFGYSAQLPQILRRAGVEFFTTQKLSWNETNKFPFNSFTWEGIDGSEVLVHFLPGHDYNSNASPGHLIQTEQRHAEKGHSKPMLYQYGYGDGGGGPTPQMIEFGRRARNFEGLPRCRPGFIRDFFHTLRRDSKDLPRWVGELYLEFHRGTYTTQAKTKLLNRRCELALREAELFGAIAMAVGGKYDRKRITECWKLVLLNQFHDVLPGSSIREVYELSEVQQAEALFSSTELARKSARAIARHIDTRGEGAPVVVWNPLSWARTGLVQVARPEGLRSAGVVDSEGEAVPSQRVPGGQVLFLASGVPAMGYRVYRFAPDTKPPQVTGLKVSEKVIENRLLRVRLNGNGELTSLYDKLERREVLRGGVGNELQLYHDRPHSNDAWEIDYYTRDQRLRLPDAASVRVVERGPARAAVEVRRTFGKSTLRQRIVIQADEPRVSFETEVDWHETHKLLKVAFPVDVRSPEATYEVQFGSLRRPTHMNTSWDAAKFEVCAQKWADLSDASYGVSLLNDCKYGYDVHGNTMRLTLLRAPKEPDRMADMGRHVFAYSVMPHPGGHADAGTVRKGYEFNVPLRHTVVTARKGTLPASYSFLQVDSPAVVLDTVKKAEADDSIILRLYEAHGGRARARLVTPLPVRSVAECDTLERKTVGRPVRPRNGTVELTFAPFEIKTLKLKLGRGRR